MWHEVLGYGIIFVRHSSSSQPSISLPLFPFTHPISNWILIWIGSYLVGVLSLGSMVFMGWCVTNLRKRRGIFVWALLWVYSYLATSFLGTTPFLVLFYYSMVKTHRKRESKERRREEKRFIFSSWCPRLVSKNYIKGLHKGCKGCNPSFHVFKGRFRFMLDEKPMKELAL